MASPTPTSAPAPFPLNTRPGLTLATTAFSLGPLADLAGTWVGSGFSLISLPSFSPQPPDKAPRDFRLKLNATFETLQFIPIGGSVPNRGAVTAIGSAAGQPDIALFGLTYLQRVSDSVTNEALHIEPGMWLHVPPTTVAPVNADDSVVRLATIPHGNSVLAQSTSIETLPAPVIGAQSSTPFMSDGSLFPSSYLDPFLKPALPPGIRPSFVANPNLVLQDAILGQNIVNTVMIRISTRPIGGILNIPFVSQNASPAQLDATFWIETVQQADGTTYLQLQYTQTVILNFLGISWPHIAVATLTKQ